MANFNETNQLRPGLWATVNERYPGAMITKTDFLPLAKPKKPLTESRLTFVSTAGVQPKDSLPFDTVHPIGDYTFRRVPSDSKVENLEIHQLKYPTVGAKKDLNVIFPIERLQELAKEKIIGELSENFFSFIGYNMDAERLEQTLAEDIADAVEAEKPDAALLAPAWPICHQSIALVQRAVEKRGIPTVSISVALDITEHIKPPRAVFLPFMMGHHFGVPHHKELQRKIILFALEMLETAERSGEVRRFPMIWAQARREGKEIENVR